LNGIPENTIIRNIKLIKPASETSIEEESVIDQFRSLMKHKIKERKFTKEERATFNTALHGFVTDLFNVGILQSGVGKTYIGFSEYIPQEYIRSLFAPALQILDNLSPADYSNFLAKYESQFRYNNPKYFAYVKKDGIKDKIKNNNSYSNRFKLYDIALNYQVDAVDEEDEASKEEVPTTTPPAETPSSIVTESTPEGKFIDVTEINRENKKEKFKYSVVPTKLEPNPEQREAEGYRIHIKEYPDFKGFVRKVENENVWVITEETTGFGIGAEGKTAKDALINATIILNRAMKNKQNIPMLEKTGITRIQPKNLPSVDVNKKC
jgi:hypothetical protein